MMKAMTTQQSDKRLVSCAPRRRFILQAGLAAGAVSLHEVARAWFWSAPTWPELKRKIRADYPSVPQLTIAQLQVALKQVDNIKLIDVRAPAEFTVSHLQGAVSLTTSAQIAKTFSADKHQALVLYCSVGWRSAKMVSELQALGFTQVSNLEGSIFEWANEGLPVYQGRERVRTVHPFDSTWKALLKPELRALQ
jgi:rhodanese-related sulfurtransferase